MLKRILISVTIIGMLIIPQFVHAGVTITNPESANVFLQNQDTMIDIVSVIEISGIPKNEFLNYAQVWIRTPGLDDVRILKPDVNTLSLGTHPTDPTNEALRVTAKLYTDKLYESSYLVLKYPEKNAQGDVISKTHEFPAICALDDSPEDWNFCSLPTPNLSEPDPIVPDPVDPDPTDPAVQDEGDVVQDEGAPPTLEIDPSDAAGADPYASWKVGCSFVSEAHVATSGVAIFIAIFLGALASLSLVRNRKRRR